MRICFSGTVALFPSKYRHIGCYEVNPAGLNLKEQTEESVLWVEYVNNTIAAVHENGKMPMIWSDHLRKDPYIAENLRREVVVVE